ncbi:unnamed protein product [Darwinula stevensoni]|uniref:Uncharacterized protein n=1 Tax=Darwinula stevensoni TaxID=69355 RepID=A0A7R9A5T5_9CRUS|nr:unnamed protein product [Darwinula stevensoni]CAG0895073.1 unnamed protein product [Darwinula stevensoni]
MPVYNVKWHAHHAETVQSFENLRHQESFIDITLFCNGQFLRAHKLVLGALSGYFERILIRDGPGTSLIHFFGMDMYILRFLVEFMYTGEVKVPSDDIEKFFEFAEKLEVKGLTGNRSKSSTTVSNGSNGVTVPPARVEDAVGHKRKSTHQSWQKCDGSVVPPKLQRSQMPRTRQDWVAYPSQWADQVLSPSQVGPLCSEAEEKEVEKVEENLIKVQEEIAGNNMETLETTVPLHAEFIEDDQLDELSSYHVEGTVEDTKPQDISRSIDPQDKNQLVAQSSYADGTAEEPEIPLDFPAEINPPDERLSDAQSSLADRNVEDPEPMNIPAGVDPKSLIHLQPYVWSGRELGSRKRSYFCPICPRVFLDKKQKAIEHSQQHTMEKPYQCFTCLKRFARKTNLQNHAIKAHQSKN